MRKYQQSVARNLMVFMTSSSNHIDGVAGLALTITASKNGGAFSSISPTVTDRGNGWYLLALTASMLDTLGDFALHITGTGVDPTDLIIEVVAYNPLTAYATSSALSTLDGKVIGTLAAGTHSPQSGDSYARIGANGSGLTAIGDTRLSNLDAAITTRSSHSINDIWSSGTRELTSAVNITSNGLPINQSQLLHLDSDISDCLQAVSYVAPDNAMIAQTYDLAQDILDFLETTGVTLPDIEEGLTFVHAMQLVVSLACKMSGGGSNTINARNFNDTKNRITWNVDSNGNRIGVTFRFD